VATGLEDCYRRRKVYRNALCQDCETLKKALASLASRRANTARYLGVNLDTQLTWAAHTNQVGRKKAKIGRAWLPP
jgi:hypothetical protein